MCIYICIYTHTHTHICIYMYIASLFSDFTWKGPSESHRQFLPEGRHIPTNTRQPRSFITMYVNVRFVVDKVARGRHFSSYCGVLLPLFTPPVLLFVYHFPCEAKKARPVRNLSLGRSLLEFPTRHSTLIKLKQRSCLCDRPFFEAPWNWISRAHEFLFSVAVVSCILPSLTAQMYRVIHKPPRDFRTRLRNNQDRHGRKEHINR